MVWPTYELTCITGNAAVQHPAVILFATQAEQIHIIGVGNVGATGALAPAMLKPRGRKYVFAPAIICQVYLLVDSQSSISLYSFKILNLNLIMYCQRGISYTNYVRHANALHCTPRGPNTQFSVAGLQDSSH